MKRRFPALICAACLIVSLAGCGQQEAGGLSSAAPGAASSQAAAESAASGSGAEASSAESAVPGSGAESSSAESAVQTGGAVSEQPIESQAASAVSQSAESSQEAGQTATLYVGMDGTFSEYPVSYTGELTPVFLISQLSELTGWNLDLADEVTSGKGGMTVSFAETSSIVTGPPEPQNPDFFVYDSSQLITTILDSVQRTLQYNFIDPNLGDPSNLDVYFNLDGGNIVYPDSGREIDAYTPYEAE